MSSIAENIAAIRTRIRKAALEAGRDPSLARLVAVSKTQPAGNIRAALEAGQRLFGENRVQEAQARWQELRAEHPGLRLHLIGPLQTNKAKEAVALFDCIETLDRARLAEALAREMEKQGRRVPCLIQVNTGEEPQKAGVLPADLAALLAHARGQCGLEVGGLMCIPPADEPPALHFAFLAKLARAHGLADLSMGMSADYERAAALGATYVRVGTALFGDRPAA